MRVLYYVAFGILGLGLILLLINDGNGSTLGMDNDSFASAVAMTSWLAVLSAFFLRRHVSRGTMVRDALIWVVIILGLVTVYRFRFDLMGLVGL